MYVYYTACEEFALWQQSSKNWSASYCNQGIDIIYVLQSKVHSKPLDLSSELFFCLDTSLKISRSLQFHYFLYVIPVICQVCIASQLSYWHWPYLSNMLPNAKKLTKWHNITEFWQNHQLPCKIFCHICRYETIVKSWGSITLGTNYISYHSSVLEYLINIMCYYSKNKHWVEEFELCTFAHIHFLLWKNPHRKNSITLGTARNASMCDYAVPKRARLWNRTC